MYDVLGIGNPLMDLSVRVEDHHLETLKLDKGTMHLVDESQAARIHELIKDFEIITTPAGSCANTIMACASLGLSAAFTGRIGMDAFGVDYEQKLAASSVKPQLIKGFGITGTSICLVTPDSQRTMATHLGASSNFTEADISEKNIKDSKIVHIEGYQLDTEHQKKASLKAMQIAHDAGVLVSFDLADVMLVKRNQQELGKILEYVDILFANEQEAIAYTGLEAEPAARQLSKLVATVAVKLGDKGSIVIQNGEEHRIRPFHAKAIDTTGAGDVYAAGLIYGIARGIGIKKSAILGSFIAARITEQYGARFDYGIAERAKKYLGGKE